MDELLKRLWDDIKTHPYWNEKERVLLAVSGGVDSMALLDVIRRISIENRPAIEVAHIHHHLREESDEELLVVKAYCEEYSLPFHVRHWYPACHPKNNLEVAAREFRYMFFSEKMKEIDAKILLTAHHADDQMETILMKITRGSSLSAYSGIQREREFSIGKLIRPLLDIEKRELYRYCLENKVPYREDASNQELFFTRNRYRNQILPLIKKENEQAARHFQAFSQDLLDLMDVVEPMVEEKFSAYFQKKNQTWELSVNLFLDEKASLQRLLLTHFLEVVWPKEGVFAKKNHVSLIIDLLNSEQPQAELSISGGRVKRRYGVLIFEKEIESEEIVSHFPIIYKELKLNQWLELPFNGKIGLFLSSKEYEAVEKEKTSVFRLVDARIQYPLMVRNWQPGDRIQLNPLKPFTKKIARIFVDKKVPKEDRMKAVVVSDANGIILSVLGYAESIWLSPPSNRDMNAKNTEHCILVFEK